MTKILVLFDHHNDKWHNNFNKRETKNCEKRWKKILVEIIIIINNNNNNNNNNTTMICQTGISIKIKRILTWTFEGYLSHTFPH